MTAPSLFGLDSEFETEGRSITQTVEKVEEMEEESPGKPFRKAKSLDEIEVIAEQASVWDVAESAEDLDSDLFWMRLSEDTYQLQIPHDVKTEHGEVTQDVSLRLEQDRLGRWTTTHKKQPVYRNGDMILRPFDEEGDTYNTLEDAIEAMDRFVRLKYSDSLALVSDDQPWHDKPASKGQIKYLRRLNVHIPDGEDLSRGKASKLINAAKAQN